MLEHITGPDFAQRMERRKIPAVSIAATKDGKNIETAVFGTENDKTMFQAASISKSVFAVAVMRLHEQGKLDVDASVGKLKLYGRTYAVTLRQLLSHTAGTTVRGFDGYKEDEPLPTVAQILAGTPPANSPKVKLKRRPGTRYDYSGGGYVLAQQIVTEALGLDFHTLLRGLVLEPCGMQNSTCEQNLPADANFASGYHDNYAQLEGRYMRMPELSAAGLWTTPADLVRMGIELQRALLGESDLLRKETIEAMLTRQPEKKPGKQSYGIGFELADDNFGHRGSNIGYRSYCQMGRHSNAAVAIMMNADNSGVSSLFGEITNAIKTHHLLQ